jgi:hypothetical protein
VKRKYAMSRLHFRAVVAGIAISTVLLSLAPMGRPALASEIGANDFRISDMGPDGARTSMPEVPGSGAKPPLPTTFFNGSVTKR